MVLCYRNGIKNVKFNKGGTKMSAYDIIKEIETAQLKAEVPEFNVGDTVRVYGKIKEGNRERVQVFEGVVLKRQEAAERPLR